MKCADSVLDLRQAQGERYCGLVWSKHGSHAGSVSRLGVQTNLSLSPRWLLDAAVDKVSLWCTYHPGQVSRLLFLRRCRELADLGVQYSVGIVAQLETLEEILAMRAELPESVYLWLNAWDGRPPDYYSSESVRTLTEIDPHFAFNLAPPPSQNAICRAGATALSVDGEGNVRPCHFIAHGIGNLYDGSFEQQLGRRPCSNARCDCYIGYALRADLPWAFDLLRQRAPVAD